MAAKNVILMGDGTSHGGTVSEGFPDVTVNGKPVAGVGHQGSCPKCKKTFVIVAGAQNVTMFGRAVALEGMKTSCGAVLIASQDMYTIDVETGGSNGANATSASTSVAANTSERAVDGSTTTATQFDMRFKVVSKTDGSALPDWPYTITLASGAEIAGSTDDDGLTDSIESTSAENATLHVFEPQPSPINPTWDH